MIEPINYICILSLGADQFVHNKKEKNRISF